MSFLGIPWKNDLRRSTALAVVFALAGAVIGILVIPHAPRKVDPNAPTPPVSLLGQRLALGPDTADKALHVVRRYAVSNIGIKVPGGRRIDIPRSSLGAQIERVRLAQLISDYRDAASPMRRALSDHKIKDTVVLPIPILIDSERGLATLLQVKDMVDQPATDARLDLETRKLIPEQDGIHLDVYATLARLVHAIRNGEPEVDAVVHRIAPRLKADQLGNVSFGEVLGWFETNYARGEKHALRTFNLRLAASRLDGYVVLPGETFDFNEVVGPRDEAHGYKVAPVIAEGELVDGIGGGTCQITGTLHGAAFFAGMTVVARRPHTRPSSYIKMGLDAAVAYPTTTLTLKNPFDFPVVLHETVRDGVVRAEVLGPMRKLTVTYVRKVQEITPFEEVERPDPKLTSGTRVLSQRGIPGFKIQRHRIVRDGAFAVRERSTDTYPPTTQIVRVGTADGSIESTEAADDAHPEYIADEYLAMTQGPGLKSPGVDHDEPGGGIVERRVPGRCGVRGWLEKEGLSHYVPSPQVASPDDCDKGSEKCKKGKPNASSKKTDRKKEAKNDPDDSKSRGR